MAGSLKVLISRSFSDEAATTGQVKWASLWGKCFGDTLSAQGKKKKKKVPHVSEHKKSLTTGHPSNIFAVTRTGKRNGKLFFI